MSLNKLLDNDRFLSKLDFHLKGYPNEWCEKMTKTFTSQLKKYFIENSDGNYILIDSDLKSLPHLKDLVLYKEDIEEINKLYIEGIDGFASLFSYLKNKSN